MNGKGKRSSERNEHRKTKGINMDNVNTFCVLGGSPVYSCSINASFSPSHKL
jgi:hypothetical protein